MESPYEKALFLMRIRAIAAAKWILCSHIVVSISLNGEPVSSSSFVALSISFLDRAAHRRRANSIRNNQVM